MKTLFLSTLFIFISLIHNYGQAKVSSEFTKTSLGRSNQTPGKPSQLTKSSSRKKRKLYLNFVSARAETGTNDQDLVADNSDSLSSKPSNNAARDSVTPKKKIGFTNDFQLGYSNSAYRYAGENYPAKSIDFGLAPSFETTCFTLKCIYLAKVVGGFDLNNNSKNELAMIQFGLKFPGNAWGGYLTPGYSILGYLPATPAEVNNDQMLYGFGGAFSLATTPELMGGKFLAFSGSVSIRKNIHDEPLTKQTDWTTRQALITDINFTKSIGATLVFGHIYGIGYDKKETEITELIQGLKWTPTDWLELSISHSNTGPMFKGEGTQVNTDLVSIDNSVISFAVGITNSF